MVIFHSFCMFTKGYTIIYPIISPYIPLNPKGIFCMFTRPGTSCHEPEKSNMVGVSSKIQLMIGGSHHAPTQKDVEPEGSLLLGKPWENGGLMGFNGDLMG